MRSVIKTLALFLSLSVSSLVMADSVRFDLYDPDEKISFDGWIILSGNNISADADEINFSDAEDVQF